MRKIACIFLLGFAITAGTFGVAYASKPFLEEFNLKYGTGGTQLDDCITCHISSNPDGNHELNPYGFDFGGKGHDFEAIELMDSDDDGFSNKAEINAMTFPGDPDSVPGEDSGCFLATAEVCGVTYPKISALILLCSIIAITVTVILIRRNRF
ncbi:MAG: hypothetical protein ACETVU_04210 [Desulfatiglandales bacterium]